MAGPGWKTYIDFPAAKLESNSCPPAPALKPLKEAYGKSWGDVEGKQFAERVFFTQTGTYEPEDREFGREKEHFLAWKTKDEPASVATYADSQEYFLALVAPAQSSGRRTLDERG